MTQADQETIHAAARLIQWGLRPLSRPSQEVEYRALVDKFRDESAFREVVRRIADGLGLDVLDVSLHGMVLAPLPESVFGMRPSDFISSSTTADDRLLYGLIQIAIAACIYPRAQDLEEERSLARHPVTVEEIEDMMRCLCARFRDETKGEPDPQSGHDMAGFYEAWRVYDARVGVKETADRKARGTTRRMIQRSLERLCEMGCFLREEENGKERFQPTWRYQVQVQDFAAMNIIDQVQRALKKDGVQ